MPLRWPPQIIITLQRQNTLYARPGLPYVALALALRTVHGATACNFGFFKGTATFFAGLAATSIDRKGILKCACIAVGVLVITNGTAAL